ncbi:MAG: glycosyltransferase family 2 protein [Actinomycetota bacterium]|nr:glycosyltransferase family 2 protein [Actinomycetota bacterium]
MTTRSKDNPTISVVIVTFRQGEDVRPTLDALTAQLREDDELIVVDNASGDGTREVVANAAPDARLVRSPTNDGFPAACNRGATRAFGELLVFLNPDAVPAPDWREAIAEPLGDGSDWDAWQALVTAERGQLVNTRGGVVHFTGIAWAGGSGEAVDGEAAYPEPGFVSGACLAIRREVFERLGGFSPEFFLYHEDVDLSLRVRLAGGRLGVAPRARVDHAYEFDKGLQKWRYLERNRWATLIRVFPTPLLLVLAPALLATEIALFLVAAAGGWLPQKRAAAGATARALPRLREERREVQATARIGAGEFARSLTPWLDSRYLGRAARSRLLTRLLAAYWGLVLLLVGAGRSA